MNPRARATAIGFGAIVLWSSLALFTSFAGAIAPFQLIAMTMPVGAALALAKWLARGESVRAHLRLPWRVWALGITGLFGYHACYFAAFALAPAVEVNLLNYLWPLLVVVFAGLLPGERIGVSHVAGALFGFAGCALIVGADGAFDAAHLAGYGAAIAAAVIWGGYSVLSRRIGHIATDSIGGFCGATALLAALSHLLFEDTRWPAAHEWLAMAAMGVGPLGLAFYLWDHGVKEGEIKTLGALSYLTPLLSTALLIAFGGAAFSWRLAAACALIVGGAAIASRDLWRPRHS
jgi:drug/metabolite transporter (DMT)-like permease